MVIPERPNINAVPSAVKTEPKMTVTTKGGPPPGGGDPQKGRPITKRPVRRKGRPKRMSHPPPRLVCRISGSPVSMNFMVNSSFLYLNLFYNE
jgi:hypothetical protein